MKTWLKRLRVAVLVPLVIALSSCGGGDEDEPQEIQGLITIESPTANSTYGDTYEEAVNLSGSRSQTAREVSWSNAASGSGAATLTAEECFFFSAGPFVCNTGWSAEVPLVVGTNVITVIAYNPNRDFGQDTITITRLACPPPSPAAPPACP